MRLRDETSGETSPLVGQGVSVVGLGVSAHTLNGSLTPTHIFPVAAGPRTFVLEAASEQTAVESSPPRSELTRSRPVTRADTAAVSAARKAGAPSAIGTSSQSHPHATAARPTAAATSAADAVPRNLSGAATTRPCEVLGLGRRF